MSEKGYVHVYTGNGKGKTTAAFGLALRAAGAGLRVYIAQFVKGMIYSELEAFARFEDLITVEQYGRGCFIRQQPGLLCACFRERVESAGRQRCIFCATVHFRSYRLLSGARKPIWLLWVWLCWTRMSWLLASVSVYRSRWEAA